MARRDVSLKDRKVDRIQKRDGGEEWGLSLSHKGNQGRWNSPFLDLRTSKIRKHYSAFIKYTITVQKIKSLDFEGNSCIQVAALKHSPFLGNAKLSANAKRLFIMSYRYNSCPCTCSQPVPMQISLL